MAQRAGRRRGQQRVCGNHIVALHGRDKVNLSMLPHWLLLLFTYNGRPTPTFISAGLSAQFPFSYLPNERPGKPSLSSYVTIRGCQGTRWFCGLTRSWWFSLQLGRPVRPAMAVITSRSYRWRRLFSTGCSNGHHSTLNPFEQSVVRRRLYCWQHPEPQSVNEYNDI